MTIRFGNRKPRSKGILRQALRHDQLPVDEKVRSSRHLLECVLYRLERFLSPRAIGSATLGHVRAAAAALAAQSRDRGLDQLHRAPLPSEVVSHPDRDAGAPLVDGE